MGVIRQLPEEIAIKIAAGEVVERPASVVKELVENALDAGATEVTITLAQGGKELIEVRDNGSGMDRDDAEKAFLRHGTSKIRSVDDLLQVMTLGFRGEALAAIAASAEGELITAEPAAIEGSVVAFQHGVLISAKPHAPRVGTTLVVRNLFGQLPARQKFLKSEVTEWKACLETVTKQAIAHPSVGFALIHNKRTVYSLPKDQLFASRVAQVWDLDEAQLISVTSEVPHLRIEGVVARAEVAHLGKARQFLSVNGHPVNDRTVMRSVRDAYGTLLPPSFQPTFALALTVHPGMVDVNIHPRKDEVRFVNGQEIFRFVWQAVSQVLEKSTKPFEELSVAAPQIVRSAPFVPPARFSFPSSSAGVPVARATEPLSFSRALPQSIDSPVASEPFSVPGDVFFVIDNCYLVTKHGDHLLLIDQHAAHERILYNQIWEQDGAKTVARQPLLVACELALTEQERVRLHEYQDELRSLGFVFDLTGEGVIVREVPQVSHRSSPEHFFHSVLKGLGDERPESELKDRKHKLFATMACKAAVKAGDVLSQTEKQRLLRDLLATPTRFTCPHGRPSHIEISAQSLEKLFKRTGF